MLSEKVIDHFRVPTDGTFKLKDHDPSWVGTDEMRDLGKKELKDRAEALVKQNLADLEEAQDRLYADDRYALLLVFQAMDAAGKDGTIKHVMSGVNPQGCQVFSFKKPSAEELDHTFLWRCQTRLPERGRIGIFNRSYYEDVLVVKVHPEYLRDPPGKGFWRDRYDDINAFERHLTRNGTIVIKFFLNVSKDEQKKRFLERLDRPEKHWKFSMGDLTERGFWKQYMEAYEDCLRATSTDWAPWYVVPADHKWITRAIVADVITDALRKLNLKYPTVTAAQKAQLAEAKKTLEAE